MEEGDYSEILRCRLWGCGWLWGIKPAKSRCRCSVCCEPERFQLRSSMLIQLCIQTVCRWYLCADKSDVQHMDELFKQGFPVKKHSGFPILATVFFWSASIRAVCNRQPCTEHDCREMEVTELLIAIILWQKHVAIYLTTRRMQPCAFPAVAQGTSGPSWADYLGITGYEDRRKWKEKVCFYQSLIENQQVRAKLNRESLETPRGSCWSHQEGSESHVPIYHSITHTNSHFHIQNVLTKSPNRWKISPRCF